MRIIYKQFCQLLGCKLHASAGNLGWRKALSSMWMLRIQTNLYYDVVFLTCVHNTILKKDIKITSFTW